ncbi:Fibrinogen-like protein 1,Fibrinogen-like protein A,Tenascin,Ryncolin-2,Ryncolin-4,Tenascin-X,Fibrinogen alpha chain,Ryncolin-1,Ficolin-1,Fibrinogen C domain-containing protein 1 [Mytilus coruscus]|uniref:Fibrinogen-like protein 1,Fibrinogen-like protein A,Tenascin,Ryncolin-2,Ryncolin-4,Tenascin-X,Fibrinogen alpha chain,Ryncolin-1,Ficolin-1,Fibrinogen C domain-containing protein 1 n=1 Tax=Mytilus coruscus TaxID=42192 RepID=A0A6J8DM01_MYTCO|nr:Fibrinogen-like protein 1,Fibrinogen-like protein A,Tenascin,Ryncolin-2,Ryncolin-4,Tenascin-X,Fibrinogen alpha chain,Ryncolin-1,Ficolin-1,Fibrinogen C domain-containing protein 1 [Mytilus coruscus]
MLLVSTEQCKSGIFHMQPNKRDTKLDGYRIRAFENISPRACFDKCIRRPRCHSYNYNRQILRCELNYQPTYLSPNDFLNEVGFNYVEVNHNRGDHMYDTCLENPCKFGEICEETKDGGVFCVKEQEEIDGDDCTNLKKINPKYESGIYTTYPSKTEEGFRVFCNMMNGGWTVIQRRIDGRVNFNRNWVEYENGFGDLQNEFWLGNKYINILTSKGSFILRVELVQSNGMTYYAEYSTFVVSDASFNYALTVYGYSGNAGNYMSHNNGRYFSTYDRDNDNYGSVNCAASFNGWWHGTCSNSFLNDDFSDGLQWGSNYFQTSQMMIQRTM